MTDSENYWQHRFQRLLKEIRRKWPDEAEEFLFDFFQDVDGGSEE